MLHFNDSGRSCSQSSLVSELTNKQHSFIFVSNYQLNAQFLYSITIYSQFMMHGQKNIKQYTCYIIILDMFRAVLCLSSGGQIILLQHLVSSLSVNGRTVRPFTDSDDTRCCNNTI